MPEAGRKGWYRRGAKLKFLGVLIPEDVFEALASKADALETTRSAVASELLREALARVVEPQP